MNADTFYRARQRLESVQHRLTELVVSSDTNKTIWGSKKLAEALEELRDAKLHYDAVCEKMTPEQREQWLLKAAKEPAPEST